MLRLDTAGLLFGAALASGFGNGPLSAALLVLRIRRVNGLTTAASDGCCTTL